MSILLTRKTIPYNVRMAVAERMQNQARKRVTKREDIEKASPSMLSDFNFTVVAGCSQGENAFYSLG